MEGVAARRAIEFGVKASSSQNLRVVVVDTCPFEGRRKWEGGERDKALGVITKAGGLGRSQKRRVAVDTVTFESRGGGGASVLPVLSQSHSSVNLFSHSILPQ